MKHIKTTSTETRPVPRNIMIELTNGELNAIVLALGNINTTTLKERRQTMYGKDEITAPVDDSLKLFTGLRDLSDLAKA